jgi:N-acetylmuramic acid 6-phosphate etherase
MTVDHEILAKLKTEQVDPKLANLDALSPRELLLALNTADADVPTMVRNEIESIERALTAIVERMERGGRIIYIGAGTSGRLGVLDASEGVPTFSVGPDLVIGFIAGGDTALRNPVEGAEDDKGGAVAQLKSISLTSQDCVVGIAASGRTPYVIGGLEYAREVGALAIALACNKNSEISQAAEIAIEIDTGPEVLSGSTRLKAGTAQKLVLNMLSTGAMVLLGKTFGNLMVDLQVTNGKLRNRAHRIIVAATGCSMERAEQVLTDAGDQVKVAILMELLGIDRASAHLALAASGGRIRPAISSL